MGAYAGPLLLLLVGVGGLVVVFGRRLRKLREEGTESAEAFSQMDGTVVRPPNERGLGRRLVVRLRDACVAALRAAVGTVRGSARLATRLLQRPPVTIRVPRLALPSPLRRRLRPLQRRGLSGEGTGERGESSAGWPKSEARAPLFEDVQAGPTSPAFEQSGEEEAFVTAEQVSKEGSSGISSPEQRGDVGLDNVVADTPHVLAHFPRSVGDDHISEHSAKDSKAFDEPTGSAVSPTASIPQEAGEISPEAFVPPVSFPAFRHDDSRAEGSSSTTETMRGVASPKGPRTAAFEEHVRERVGGRRKVVGRVRMKPARPLASKSRRPVKDALPKASERGQLGVLRPDAPRTPPEGDAPLLVGMEKVQALLEGGDLETAEEILVDALAENPRDLEAYRLLGVLYIRRGDFGQAREVLEEALRRDPEETSLYGFLGETYFTLGEYGKSLQMYQRAHDADEKNVGYLEQLLRIATRMDRRPLVRVTAEKILALEPNHPEAKKQLARATLGG